MFSRIAHAGMPVSSLSSVALAGHLIEPKRTKGSACSEVIQPEAAAMTESKYA